MFDVVAKSYDVQIKSFKLRSYSSSGTVEIWTRSGSYVGNQNSSSGWTKIVDFSFDAGAQWSVVDIPESSLTQTVTIGANSRRAFYTTLKTGENLVISGANGTPVAEDDNMIITEGFRMDYLFGGSTTLRRW